MAAGLNDSAEKRRNVIPSALAFQEDSSVASMYLYTDDSMCIQYGDGSSLQLSPCGSVFVHHQPTSKCAQQLQLTRFAISKHRSKTVEALRVRNQFAERPYLCEELCDQTVMMVHYKKVSQSCWPMEATSEFIRKLSDGSVQVRSIEGHASLTLMSHQQTFTVKFLGEVSAHSNVSNTVQGSSKQRSPLGGEDKNQALPSSTAHSKLLYTWVEHVHSVNSYPDTWDYPLRLALGKQDDPVHTRTHGDSTSDLPSSLPVSCGTAHAHNWRMQVPQEVSGDDIFWQPNIKVVCKDNIIYRIYRKSHFVEIHPGDGSLMRSTGLLGKYFTHWFYQKNQASVVERVYSRDAPPPDVPGTVSYSVRRLVRNGARFLEFLSRICGRVDEDTCCWKKDSCRDLLPVVASLPELVETAELPNVGKFKVYSNGTIHIVFADRTILVTECPNSINSSDLENRLGTSRFCELEEYYQLTLPNGVCVSGVNASIPQEFQRHIQAAKHWRDWVKAGTHKRRTFYKDTAWDLERQRAVNSEISKLTRFNYILEHSSPSAIQENKENTKLTATQDVLTETSTSHCDQNTLVNNVLQRTATAISDIDSFLTEATRRL